MKSGKIAISAADLADLAERINAAHIAGAACSAKARAHAAEAGRMLLEAERDMRPKAFMEWVEGNCRFDPRMARWYMLAAEDEKQAGSERLGAMRAVGCKPADVRQANH